MTKEDFFEELVHNAATRVAKECTPHTVEIMIPVWQDIIRHEMKPLLEMIK